MDQFDPLITPTSPAKEKKKEEKKETQTPWPFPTGKPPRPGLRIGKNGKWEFIPPSGWVEPKPPPVKRTPGKSDLAKQFQQLKKEIDDITGIYQYQQQYLLSPKPVVFLGDVVCWKKEKRLPMLVVGFQDNGNTAKLVVQSSGQSVCLFVDELERYQPSLFEMAGYKHNEKRKNEGWNKGRPPKDGWYETRKIDNQMNPDERALFWRGEFGVFFGDDLSNRRVGSEGTRLWRALDGSPNTP